MFSTALILCATIVVFLINKVPPAIVAVGVALALYLTGTLGFDQIIAGFGDPLVIYLAGLFVVSESLDATGVTAWAGQQLVRRIGHNKALVLAALMLLSAFLTALISVNGAVAALVPVAVMLSTRLKVPPSQILIPLAFAAHAGSMLTLLGTPVNLLVSDLAVEAGARPFGFFEFAIVGIPLLAGVILLSIFLGPRFLPHHVPTSAPKDLSEHAETLAAEYQLEPGSAGFSVENGAIEIVIPPRSPFLGEEVHPGMPTESGDLVIVAVNRTGKHLERARLQVGDVLVMRGTWDALETRAVDASILPVDRPDAVRRQSVHLGSRSYISIVVLVLMCTLLATNVLPAVVTVLTAATVLVGVRVITVNQAQASISLPTLVIVAGMIPLSTAMQTSGLADVLSHWLVDTFGDSSPYLLLAAIMVIVLVLGQFLSNLATVLIVAPVAIAVSETAGISPLPMMMGITIAGAASFLTPIATPGNLMVQEPGAYQFGDYWRIGLPCLLLFGAVAVFFVPAIWHF